MQKREKVSSMDLKVHLNKLRKNPKFTDEMLKLVEGDLEYGLSIEETDEYTMRKFDYAQMKVYSICLRRGYPQEIRRCITREGLSGEQMEVALEFYEKGVPVEKIAEITGDTGYTALVMRNLFSNVLDSLKEAQEAAGKEAGYAAELMEQIKSVVEQIKFQESRYDALNERLKELKTAGQDTEVQNHLLADLSEKDRLLEKQQNELNEARTAIARLRNEMDTLRREIDKLEKRTEEKDKYIRELEKRTEKIQQIPENINPAMFSDAKIQKAEKKIPSHAAILDADGNIISVLPVEQMQRKKENHFMTALLSRIAFKKKIDIVRLVVEKELAPKQLVQIRYAIEKGLSEEQLLILINKQIPAEQMEEIIGIAVYENRQKQEG